MLSDERIEQLELEVKVLRANNKGLKDKIDEQSKEIEELNYIKRSFDYCVEQENKKWEDKIKAKIEEKFLEAKGLYERGVQPQAQYTMKLLRDLEKSLLEKE